jgi:hypothetical protein
MTIGSNSQYMNALYSQQSPMAGMGLVRGEINGYAQ